MTTEPQQKAEGKGRPTPKRREAERQRKQRVTAPKTRKEANKLQREESKRRRHESREAMTGKGDLSRLPPRDAGPVRAFVRDYVDSRRTAGTFFLPAAFLIFALGLNPVPVMRLAANGLLVLIVVIIALDARRLCRGMLREVQARFPDEPTKGLQVYTVSRAMQIRRLRMPKPRVNINDPV